MSVDPYHAVQSEIQSSLATAEQLRASFLRIRSTAHEGNEELEWVSNEVSAEYVRCFSGLYSRRVGPSLAQGNALCAGS